jgi:hypothetical protein
MFYSGVLDKTGGRGGVGGFNELSETFDLLLF